MVNSLIRGKLQTPEVEDIARAKNVYGFAGRHRHLFIPVLEKILAGGNEIPFPKAIIVPKRDLIIYQEIIKDRITILVEEDINQLQKKTQGENGSNQEFTNKNSSPDLVFSINDGNKTLENLVNQARCNLLIIQPSMVNVPLSVSTSRKRLRYKNNLIYRGLGILKAMLLGYDRKSWTYSNQWCENVKHALIAVWSHECIKNNRIHSSNKIIVFGIDKVIMPPAINIDWSSNRILLFPPNFSSINQNISTDWQLLIRTLLEQRYLLAIKFHPLDTQSVINSFHKEIEQGRIKILYDLLSTDISYFCVITAQSAVALSLGVRISELLIYENKEWAQELDLEYWNDSNLNLCFNQQELLEKLSEIKEFPQGSYEKVINLSQKLMYRSVN